MSHSLAATAKHLASKGRNGDTMLVHMNPLEVAWLDRQTPNGLTINPDTGQPEAFAFLLPLLAGMAGPGLMGAMGISGLGATLGTAALTGLADYAVHKDAKHALGSGLLSFGMGGLGDALKGGAQAIKAAPGIASNVTSAADGIRIAGGQIPTAAAPAMSAMGQQALKAPTGMLSSLGTAGKAIANPSAAWNAVKANPMGIGAPIAAGAALQASGMMQPTSYKMGSNQDDKYKSAEYTRERFPQARTVNQYTGDYSRYGIDNPEFNFFTPNNDRSPAGLGAYGMPTGMATGGAVIGEGNGVSDSIPAIGPGDRPIQLSDGEYVVPADVVSMLGHGSSNGGIRFLDQMIAQTRANPPRKEKGSPPNRMAA